MSFRTAQHTRPPCVVAALGIKGYTMADSALHYDGFASDIFRYGNTAVFLAAYVEGKRSRFNMDQVSASLGHSDCQFPICHWKRACAFLIPYRSEWLSLTHNSIGQSTYFRKLFN